MGQRLLRFYRTEEGVVRQLQWHLFIHRVYLPIKRQYERQFRSNLQDVTPNASYYSNHANLDDQMTQRQPLETIRWTFPKFPRIFRVYNVISNIILSWIFLKYLFPGLFVEFGKLVGSLFGLDPTELKPSCYLFGRLIIHYEISSESLGFILALLHILWRSFQLLMERPFELNLVLFLMVPKRNVERFINKLHSTRWLSTCDEKRHLTDYERFLCHIMCYKVVYGRRRHQKDNQLQYLYYYEPDHNHHHDYRHPQEPEEYPIVLYKLRPNRTLEARQQLVDGLVTILIVASSAIITLIVTFLGYYLASIFFNQYRYLNAYPGCDLNLMRLQEEGKLTRWSGFPSHNRHHLISGVLDIIENGLWLDHVMVIVYGLMFVNHLNSDLLIHWTHLDRKLQRMTLESKQLIHTNLRDEETSTASLLLANLDDEIYNLQAELSDFFLQINQVNMLISDVISFALLIWLGYFGSISLESAKLYSSSRNASFAIVCLILSVFVFFGYARACFSLLSLQRCCKSSYLNICTLMAYDQSRHKRQFMRIVDYYTRGNRTCYTLFQQFPYSSNNFASIIGWSISCYLVLDSVFYRR